MQRTHQVPHWRLFDVVNIWTTGTGLGFFRTRLEDIVGSLVRART
jgi:hypothetical protein